jgi:hypothetical protein
MIHIKEIQPEQIEEAKSILEKVTQELWGLSLDGIRQYDSLSNLDDISPHYFHNGGTFLILLDGESVVGTCGVHVGGCGQFICFPAPFLGSPLMALVLAMLARGLAGRQLPRALTISIFTWVTYTLNTVVESLAFTTTTVEGAMFTTISFLFPSIFVGITEALLFPSGEKPEDIITKLERILT